MNLLLHGIEGGVELADTLSPDGERLPKSLSENIRRDYRVFGA
jgi:hypothetical protein